MSAMSEDKTNLKLAVQAIWTGCGEIAPTGEELDAAAETLAKAWAVGRAIPRTADKTFQPMVGPRRDLEA